MRTYRVQLAVLILSITALVCAGVWVTAGTTGSVSGILKDIKTGEPLSGANVIVTGTNLSTVTDENGRFVIANIPPGDYDLTAQMVGYHTEVMSDVQVIMDATASADFDMTQEAIEEEAVVVTRPKPMINPEVVSTFNLVSVQQEPLTRTDPSSVRTAPGVLSALPGVIVESDGSGQLHLRGGKYDQVGWYIEGIPITDPNIGAFGTDLLTTGLSKFQMYAGAFGAEYGNAISGVLNEVIKTGATAAGTNFVTESGSDTYGSMIGEFGGGNAESFNYYVGAYVQQTDLDAPFMKRLEYSDNVTKLVWPSKNDKVTLLAMQGSQYGGLSDYHTIGVYNNTIPSELDYVRQRYALGGLEWSHNINPASFVSVQPYYHYFTSVTNAMGGSFGSAQGADIWSSRMGIQVKYVNQLNAVHAFNIGGSIEESNNNYYIAVPNYPYYEADVDTTQSGLYAEDQMKLSDKLTFSAGLRHDSITYNRTGLAYVNGAGYSGDPVPDATQTKTTPRFGLSYAPDETSAWKTSWGKYAKFVPANSVQMIYIYPDDNEPYAPGLGSSDPQTSTNYELTYEKQATDTIAWRATYFNNEFQNLSSYALLDNGTYQYRNLGEGKSNGMEFYVRKKMSDKWQGWLSYTYAKAESNRADIGINDQMYYSNWDQRNTISLVADYKNGACAHSLRADYGSGRPDMAGSLDELAVRSRANPSLIVSYNLNIDLPKGSRLGDSLYLNIFNLFNNHQTLQYRLDTNTSADDPPVVTTERNTDSWVPSRSFALGVTRAF